MMPHSTTTAEHAVVDRAHVAAAPGADARAAGPQDVGDRAHHALELSSCVLNRIHAPRNAIAPPSAAPGLRADASRERGADAEALNVGAARQERHVEQRRQHHAEKRADEEHAPLIGAHDPPPAAPAAHRLGVRREHEAGVREVHLVAADGRRRCSRRARPCRSPCRAPSSTARCSRRRRRPSTRRARRAGRSPRRPEGARSAGWRDRSRRRRPRRRSQRRAQARRSAPAPESR